MKRNFSLKKRLLFLLTGDITLLRDPGEKVIITSKNIIFKQKRKSISQSKRIRIFKKHNHNCFYCNSKFKVDKLTIDHYVPYSKTQNNEEENLVPACKGCNFMKKALDPTSEKDQKAYQKFLSTAKKNGEHRNIQITFTQIQKEFLQTGHIENFLKDYSFIQDKIQTGLSLNKKVKNKLKKEFPIQYQELFEKDSLSPNETEKAS